MRKAFEPQLTNVLTTNPVYSRGIAVMYTRIPIERSGMKFVALVKPGMGLGCELDIDMQVNHEPGSVITQAGDLDNRLKTLLDALRIPKDAQEFRGHTNTLPPDNAFVCLLENDAAVTKICISTERWLAATNRAENEVRLSIKTRITVLVPSSMNERYSSD